MNLQLNAVLGRELRERMRSRKAGVILTLYLLVLTAILFLVYTATADTQGGFNADLVTRAATVGRSLFEWILFFMLLLVVFLVPGLTAGSIAGERERQTLIPLQVTLMKPLSIVLGKIGASTAFIGLLIISAAPILAVAYLVGGVTIMQIVSGLVGLLLTAAILATLAIVCSTLVKRVQAATVLSYFVAFLMIGGTFLLLIALATIDGTRGNDEVEPIVATLLPNPMVAIADVIGDPGQFEVTSPFGAIRDGLLYEDAFFNGGGFNGPDNEPNRRGLAFPFWIQSLVTMTAVSIVGLFFCTRRLRTPQETDR